MALRVPSRLSTVMENSGHLVVLCLCSSFVIISDIIDCIFCFIEDALFTICVFVFKALKMSYFSNKPAPTPGSMLPQPVLLSAVVNEPLEKRSLKRKQSASSESGLHCWVVCEFFYPSYTCSLSYFVSLAFFLNCSTLRAFSALMLLVGRQEGHPACKTVVGCWRGYLSGARCWLAHGPADATAIRCLASVKSRLVLPFWYRLTWVLPEKGPLNVYVAFLNCSTLVRVIWGY